MTDTKTAPQQGANGVVPDFDFARLDIRESTSRYEMPLVSPGATLIGRPAMEMNRPYRDALLSISGRRERLRRAVLERDFDGDQELDRQDDLRIFPGHVIVGWEGIRNRAGEEVPFTIDNCRAFLKALPSWLFDRVRIHFRLPENFVAIPEDVPPGDVEALAKN